MPCCDYCGVFHPGYNKTCESCLNNLRSYVAGTAGDFIKDYPYTCITCHKNQAESDRDNHFCRNCTRLLFKQHGLCPMCHDLKNLIVNPNLSDRKLCSKCAPFICSMYACYEEVFVIGYCQNKCKDHAKAEFRCSNGGGSCGNCYNCNAVRNGYSKALPPPGLLRYRISANYYSV